MNATISSPVRAGLVGVYTPDSQCALNYTWVDPDTMLVAYCPELFTPQQACELLTLATGRQVIDIDATETNTFTEPGAGE